MAIFLAEVCSWFDVSAQFPSLRMLCTCKSGSSTDVGLWCGFGMLVYVWWCIVYSQRRHTTLYSTGGASCHPFSFDAFVEHISVSPLDYRMRAWIDMALMSLTFILTIIWNVQVGVVVSLIISLLLVVRRSSKTRMSILVGLHFELAP